jgi:outer membrane protein OmpA-like peptidoglycan-associated protein
MEQGLRPSRITTMGKGEREPVATNDTEAGRQQNRRVEVAIYASEEYREAVQERTN